MSSVDSFLPWHMHIAATTSAERITAYLNLLATEKLLSLFIRKWLVEESLPIFQSPDELQSISSNTLTVISITCSIVSMILDEFRNRWEEIFFCYIILFQVVFLNLIMPNVSTVTSEINNRLWFSAKMIDTINLIKFYLKSMHTKNLKTWDSVP